MAITGGNSPNHPYLGEPIVSAYWNGSGSANILHFVSNQNLNEDFSLKIIRDSEIILWPLKFWQNFWQNQNLDIFACLQSKCVIESLPQYDIVVPPPMSVLWNKQTVPGQEMGITLRFCGDKKKNWRGWRSILAKRSQKRKQNLRWQRQFVRTSY